MDKAEALKLGADSIYELIERDEINVLQMCEEESEDYELQEEHIDEMMRAMKILDKMAEEAVKK